jgi:hypothetical protein
MISEGIEEKKSIHIVARDENVRESEINNQVLTQPRSIDIRKRGPRGHELNCAARDVADVGD